MALTAPASLSLLHGAIRPRGVYLSGPGKVFAVWSLYAVGGVRFAARPQDGAVGSEFLLPPGPDTVRDFDVAPVSADRAAVVYDDGRDLKFFVYDFVADTLITPVTVLESGLDPTTANDGKLRTTYVDDNIVKMITDLVGEPMDLVSSPAYVLREHNIGASAPYALRYLGAHSRSVDVALPIRAGANSVLVHDCRDNPVPYPAYEPQSLGLVAYFKLDDNAPDTVVENTIGAVEGVLLGGNNTEDISVAGKVGGALNFNGSSDYVNTGYSLTQNAEGSISLWLNLSGGSGTRIAFGRQDGSSGRLYIGVSSTGYIGFGVGNNYIDQLLTNVSATVGVDYHVVVTFNGSQVKAYVDGVLKNTWSQSGAPATGVDFFIGASTSTGVPGSWFPGPVDDVRVYNRALTQDDIDDIYNGGAGIAAPPPYPTETWDQYFSDKSGNGNDLTFMDADVRHSPGVGLRLGRAPEVAVDWTVPAFFLTLESLFRPMGQESRGRMLDGPLFAGYDAWGRVYWGFVAGATTHLYRQTRLVGLRRADLNHMAVTHQWGVAASTRLYLNGLLVPGEWAQGTGATDPALGAITSTVDLAPGDYLVQLSVDDVIKSQADIEDYARGRL